MNNNSVILRQRTSFRTGLLHQTTTMGNSASNQLLGCVWYDHQSDWVVQEKIQYRCWSLVFASIEKEKKGLCFIKFVNGRTNVFFFICLCSFKQTAIHECLM